METRGSRATNEYEELDREERNENLRADQREFCRRRANKSMKLELKLLITLHFSSRAQRSRRCHYPADLYHHLRRRPSLFKGRARCTKKMTTIVIYFSSPLVDFYWHFFTIPLRDEWSESTTFGVGNLHRRSV